ncbi:MAG: aminopeptidase P N-terminal domain-containing protein [Bacteroidales bacterium]|jgi:Xaa-Pro aminopeptidase|nr:aminopeptidase P N-terminal domain-containing protein [Bacteroidales bacterium]
MKEENKSQAFFVSNRKRLLPLLEEQSLTLLFSNDEMPRTGDQYFPFRQNSNLFYLSGIDQPNVILAICPQHPNPALREILFIEPNTPEDVIRNGYKYTKEEANSISGVETVYPIADFERTLLSLTCHAQHIYLDLPENPRYSYEIECRQRRRINQLKALYPLHNYHRLYPLLSCLRLIKSPEELHRIQHACEITAKAFKRTLNVVRPSMMEYEVEAEIAHEFIRNGITAHAFAPIVASGKNACVLHYTNNRAVCKNGDLLLLDFGAEYANYASDLSRTIPVNGTFSQRQRQIYNACYRVYEYAKTLFVPGMSINKVYKKVCEAMQPELVSLGLFTQKDIEKQTSEYALMKKYFMHNIAHFIGLDVHDVGTTDIVFEEGMVLSCEPGIYIAEEETGVRIETTLMVSSVPFDFMSNLPVSPDDIELMMRLKLENF